MKLNNLALLKLIIRMLVIMIFFVIIFLISAVLYSARYWPDVYNYINASITIKRIPTISELNITIIEVEYTTEYSFTDYTDASTIDDIDINIDEFTRIENLAKREVPIESFSDIVELPAKNVVVDYMFEDTTVFGETKIVKDLVDSAKLVPRENEDVEIMDGLNEVAFGEMVQSCHGQTPGIKQVYPWIASIFIKTDDNQNQFSYYCDGGLISDKHIITAARCMQSSNSNVNPDDVLVFLGKTSLQAVAENEKTVKVSKIQTHDNFTSTDGVYANDLAILTLEDSVRSNDIIRPACFDDGEDKVEQTATTAWTIAGDVTPVYFINKNTACSDKKQNIICATYGNDVPLCPNYGGLYVVKRSKLWYLRGIRIGDPEDRGICFNKDVQYTDFGNYQDWIVNIVNNK